MTNTNPENLIDSVENLNLGKEINQIKSLEEHNSFQQNEEKSLREKHGEQNLRHKKICIFGSKQSPKNF